MFNTGSVTEVTFCLISLFFVLLSRICHIISLEGLSVYYTIRVYGD